MSHSVPTDSHSSPGRARWVILTMLLGATTINLAMKLPGLAQYGLIACDKGSCLCIEIY
jgi:hypothetical protein